jgi:hypothetical protein
MNREAGLVLSSSVPAVKGKLTSSTNTGVGADHDDLVLACALATWYARCRKVGYTTLKVIY